jgi:hypothetical protein
MRRDGRARMLALGGSGRRRRGGSATLRLTLFLQLLGGDKMLVPGNTFAFIHDLSLPSRFDVIIRGIILFFGEFLFEILTIIIAFFVEVEIFIMVAHQRVADI